MPPKSQLNQPLSSLIRANTDHDLADALALSDCLLTPARGGLDNIAFAFSKAFFTGWIIVRSYEAPTSTLVDLLAYVDESQWTDLRQVPCAIFNSVEFSSPAARAWQESFHNLYNKSPACDKEGLIRRCLAHWRAAIGKKAKRPRNSIVIFEPEKVEKAIEDVSRLDEEKRRTVGRTLDNALDNSGFRRIPDPRKAYAELDVTKNLFENLVDPIRRLQIDLTLAGAMKPDHFHITPILLLGDPGIGKTYLASQLARSLGVTHTKISAGGAMGSFQLTGSHPSWRGAMPGQLVSMLSESASASPVLIFDEVDKLPSNGAYPMLPVLLDLLEPQTAKCFKDEFFDLPFDASRIITILTANNIDEVAPALLSRVEVFKVPRPDPAQRLRIIENYAALLRQRTRTKIELDKDSSARLADRVDVDLRQTTRAVEEAIAMAMLMAQKVAKLELPTPALTQRGIGFAAVH